MKKKTDICPVPGLALLVKCLQKLFLFFIDNLESS